MNPHNLAAKKEENNCCGGKADEPEMGFELRSFGSVFHRNQVADPSIAAYHLSIKKPTSKVLFQNFVCDVY